MMYQTSTKLFTFNVPHTLEQGCQGVPHFRDEEINSDTQWLRMQSPLMAKLRSAGPGVKVYVLNHYVILSPCVQFLKYSWVLNYYLLKESFSDSNKKLSIKPLILLGLALTNQQAFVRSKLQCSKMSTELIVRRPGFERQLCHWVAVWVLVHESFILLDTHFFHLFNNDNHLFTGIS